jgi:serine/threonine protein kinase
MLKIAPHANAACLFGLVLAPPALVLEFCDGGSLDQALGLEDPAHRRVFGDAECRHVALGVARGMAHLHAARIVHRDLASRNVLLRLSPLTAKVSDFGMSRIVDDDGSGQTMTLTGPIKWQAPEQFRGTPRQYSLKSDVFSFAVLLTELVGNCLPWPDVTNTVAAVAVHRGERTPVPERMTALLRAVVGKCWAQAADARPSMADVVAMLNTDDGQD